MAAKLPYLSTPGTLKTALDRIKAAATPPTFNNDFVETKLQIRGGAGRAIPPFLKKIGLVGGDGKPTKLYERFRNSNAAVSGRAIAEAMRTGYKPIFDVNEYANDLNDKDLKGLLVQVTGLEEANRVIELVVATFKRLKEFADFEAEASETEEEEAKRDEPSSESGRRQPLAIGYTINLNLPPSTNVEVFNAIFKALRENILIDD